MIEYLIPAPFLLVMIAALLWPRRSEYVGYLGAAAGLVTLALVYLTWRSGTPGGELEWFAVAGTMFTWSVMVDQLSLLLAGIVAGIGTFIFLYSVGYMDASEELRRYYAELALFATSMLAVVMSANLFQLFFAWELVGVSSYLLIGYWHDRKTAIAAARKAFITIIIGDAFLLAGIFLLWKGYGTFAIAPILEAARADTITTIAGLFIIIGAISKSAQFPLHAWLPDAMEGPTPVSAFLHSATMVKAGLFLVARFLPLLAIAGLSPVLIIIAVITIIISACMALVENDIKRVLAYSTMNQLAFILLAFGLGATVAGLYHLLNHSVFKALLFMAAGVIIHLAGTQDIRQMELKLGWNVLAVTTAIGALALAGLPPLSGFFSKDAIFEQILHTGNAALILVFSIAIIMSAAYISRWYLLIFRRNGSVAHVHWQMRAPLPILAALVVFGGLITGMFYSWWDSSASASLFAGVLSTILALAGFGIAYAIYWRGMDINWLSRSSMAEFFRQRFLLDDLGSALASAVQGIGKAMVWVDTHIVDRTVVGVGHMLSAVGALLRRFISGHPTNYLFAFVIGFIIIIITLRFVL
jgi:NADH-quinone oxidoreductase subunit L